MFDYKQKSIKEITANAKGQMIGHYGLTIGAFVIIEIFATIAGRLAAIPLPELSFSELLPVNHPKEFLLSVLIGWVCTIMLGIFTYGLNSMILKIARKEEPLSISEIFVGFKKDVDKILIISIFSSFVTLAGYIPEFLVIFFKIPISYFFISVLESICILIAGFIFDMFLCFSYFVLIDHPEYSIDEILEESVRLLSGRRLRFLGLWIIIKLYNLLGTLALSVGILWTMPLGLTMLANFYLDSLGKEPASNLDPETEKATYQFTE